MKLTIDKTHLAAALTAAKRVISNRSTQPVLANVLIETDGDLLAKFTATDLDTWLTWRAPAPLQEEPGAVAIPGNLLAEHVSRLPDDEVTIETQDNMALVTCRRSKAQFLTLPAADFPVMPTPGEDEPQTLGIEQPALKRLLNRVSYAASTEESRSLLMGVLFDCTCETGLTLVATDTHQLASVRDLDPTHDTRAPSFVLPVGAAADLSAMLGDTSIDVLIRFAGNRAEFAADNWTLTSRLLDGQFPDYEKVIPTSGDTILKANRIELLEAIRRTHIVARENTNKARFNISDNQIEITASSPDVGESHEIVSCELSGPWLAVALNTQFPMNLLSALDAETVTMELTGALSPVVFYGDRAESRHVVMPMSQ